MTWHDRSVGNAPLWSSTNLNPLAVCMQTAAGQRHYGFWLAKNWVAVVGKTTSQVN